MSDLGAIFHVKKDGVQYDAHAYTTLDECPEPNLKLTYKGQQAYVKLEAKGDGDVPCYVKPKSGSTMYQVKKSYESVPTGKETINVPDLIDIQIPAGVNVIKVSDDFNIKPLSYVGVTPGTTYRLRVFRRREEDILILMSQNRTWYLWDTDADAISNVYISWSPEINKQTPTVTDY